MSKTRYGKRGIQLLRSHLGGRGRGTSKCERMRIGGVGVALMQTFA